MRPLARFIGSVVGVAIALSGPLGGQEAPDFVGRVVAGDSGRPIWGLQLRFKDGPWVTTDRAGHFRVLAAVPGVHSVAAVTPWCESVLLQLIVHQPPTADTTVVVPEHLGNVDPLLEVGPEQGIVLTSREIMEAKVRTLAEVVRRHAPEMVVGIPSQPGQSGRTVGRSRPSLRGPSTPTYFLDGIWLGTDSRILWDLRPEQVGTLQILRGTNGGWQYGSPGGVVKIWLRRGGNAPALGGPSSCEVEGFVRGRG